PLAVERLTAVVLLRKECCVGPDLNYANAFGVLSFESGRT
ncbi:MAG: hypothetical protein ACI8XM_000822, partial [Haloarculaceae archaeon]